MLIFSYLYVFRQVHKKNTIIYYRKSIIMKPTFMKILYISRRCNQMLIYLYLLVYVNLRLFVHFFFAATLHAKPIHLEFLFMRKFIDMTRDLSSPLNSGNFFYWLHACFIFTYRHCNFHLCEPIS